jgi:hypothetical protein
MTKRTTLAFIAAIALFLAACGGGAADATPTSVVVLGQETAAVATAEAGGSTGGGASVGSGLCAHPYYPVVVGATHTYSSTGADAPFSFTDTITDVRENGFTLSSDFGELIRTQEWECTPEGLVTLQFTGGASAAIQTSGMNATFETVNVTGVSLPHNVAPGDTWSQSFDITGDVNMATGDTATSTGTASISFAAVSIEDVATNAGTFTALRVESVMSVTLEVNYEGIVVPITLDSNAVSWYAEGVGWVRTEDVTTLEGGSFSYTVDLDSYTIP